jgi:hypothetical protein
MLRDGRPAAWFGFIAIPGRWQQRGAGGGDLGIEILAEAPEAGLQPRSQAVALGHPHFADPAVLEDP